MVEESRLELNAKPALDPEPFASLKGRLREGEGLRISGQALTPMQTETPFSYIEPPRIFDDINEMIEELKQVEHPGSIEDGDDETAQLLAALEALQAVDSDEKFVTVLEAHSIFASPGTPTHLRGLSELAQSRGDDEKAEYFNNLAEILEQATDPLLTLDPSVPSRCFAGSRQDSRAGFVKGKGHNADSDTLIKALAAIAGVNSEEELDAVFLAHPILSRPESIGQLRHAAAEVDDENRKPKASVNEVNTAQFYNDVADMLEERQIAELPPNLNEALQAFVEADSNEERIAAITLHPVLHSPEAIAYFRQRAAMAYQTEEESVAEFWENLAEMMERIRRAETVIW
jgi:hypothetical protein